MGPIALFDKSFLQSLSVDESVWFDHFFLANVCPIFYVETLADLEKSAQQGRTPEQEVGLIADKFPDMHGTPSLHHACLCIGNLLGFEVPMTGQIPMAGGRPVKSGGKTGVVFEHSPEAEAFSRWQKREFLEIERRYAQAWRQALSNLDLGEFKRAVRALGLEGKSCKTLEEAKALAVSIVCSRHKPLKPTKLALMFLNVSGERRRQILHRWSSTNCPPLSDYAPYVVHVLTVQIFLEIALAASLISSERPSNRVDIAYLFYLPFCDIFVSADRLHRRCAPLFLRKDQQFIWGDDLKKGLCQLNEHYSHLPESTKRNGVMSFACNPPKDGDFFVAHIWDRHMPNWRQMQDVDLSMNSCEQSKIVEEIRNMADAPSVNPREMDFDPTDTDSLVIQRRVRRMKGSWYQIPKNLKE
ncbi:MAG: hypothetical protein AB1696_11355 [Planctomycetota bacterium]